MKKIVSTFFKFSDVIKELNDSNVVLGGSSSLVLHGLELGRDISDIDLIIYRPTPKQLSILRRQVIENRPANTEYAGRVTKFNIKTIFSSFNLDVIVENSRTPKNLLFYDSPIGPIRIQSVKNVIDAKAGYKLTNNKNSRSKISFPQKDVKDFQNLKNLNFNY